MTDYEAKLVKEYESNGLEFLCVVSGGDSIDLNIEVAHEYGIPVREVFRVQGDCIGYDTKNDLWNSRWLMFRYRDWQALCGNSLEWCCEKHWHCKPGSLASDYMPNPEPGEGDKDE